MTTEERLKEQLKTMDRIIHNQIVASQAAWIEWQHGKGAEAAMTWIHNGLYGPGNIPNENEPYGKEAQAWMDANRADKMPACHCGKPSHILWMGHGACCNEHMDDIQKSGNEKH